MFGILTFGKFSRINSVLQKIEFSRMEHRSAKPEEIILFTFNIPSISSFNYRSTLNYLDTLYALIFIFSQRVTTKYFWIDDLEFASFTM